MEDAAVQLSVASAGFASQMQQDGPAWEMIPDPPTDTVILGRQAVFVTGKCLG